MLKATTKAVFHTGASTQRKLDEGRPRVTKMLSFPFATRMCLRDYQFSNNFSRNVFKIYEKVIWRWNGGGTFRCTTLLHHIVQAELHDLLSCWIVLSIWSRKFIPQSVNAISHSFNSFALHDLNSKWAIHDTSVLVNLTTEELSGLGT